MKVSQLKQLIKEAVKEAIKEELGTAQQEVAPAAQTVQETATPKDVTPLQEMLNETRRNMSPDQYKQVMGFDSTSARGFTGQTPNMGQQPGLDLSQLDFAKKAGAIYSRSNELDKAKNGL